MSFPRFTPVAVSVAVVALAIGGPALRARTRVLNDMADAGAVADSARVNPKRIAARGAFARIDAPYVSDRSLRIAGDPSLDDEPLRVSLPISESQPSAVTPRSIPPEQAQAVRHEAVDSGNSEKVRAHPAQPRVSADRFGTAILRIRLDMGEMAVVYLGNGDSVRVRMQDITNLIILPRVEGAPRVP